VAKNQDISGVGGWLALLVFGLMILGPLLGLGALLNEFSTAVEQLPQLANNAKWQDYQQISWLIYTVSVAISFSAGYRLWKIHFPESVRFAIISQWLAGPLTYVLHQISGIVMFDMIPDGDTIARMVGGTIAAVIGAGIWTAYLMLSVRVRNTYKPGAFRPIEH